MLVSDGEMEAGMGSVEGLLKQVMDRASKLGLWSGSGRVAVMHGTEAIDTERTALFRMIDSK